MVNLEETMDEENYDQLPQQSDATYTWEPRDRRNNKVYEWKTRFTVTGRRGRQDILGSKPGSTDTADQASTIQDLFDCYITPDMINDIVRFTNVKIEEYRQSHPNMLGNDKYMHMNVTTPMEVKALFGLMYVRGAIGQNLLSLQKVFNQKSSCNYFVATMVY